MSRPVELEESVEHGTGRGVVDPAAALAAADRRRAAAGQPRCMVGVGMVALLAAALVLTSSVVSRYVLHASTDWQDEAAVFCLVGATFLCAAYVQSLRGHVGIEALVDAAAAARERRAPAARRRAVARVLRLLRVEVVDAVPRGLGRQADHVVDLGAAAVDPVRPDGGRHDAAVRCSSLVQIVATWPTLAKRRAMSLLDARRCCSASSRCS